MTPWGCEVFLIKFITMTPSMSTICYKQLMLVTGILALQLWAQWLIGPATALREVQKENLKLLILSRQIGQMAGSMVLHHKPGLLLINLDWDTVESSTFQL